jgi:YVTN family beta-propeller protein
VTAAEEFIEFATGVSPRLRRAAFLLRGNWHTAEDLDGAPWAMAITPGGKTAYVANSLSGTVTPINTATNTAGPPIRVGGYPYAVVIAP